MQFQISSRKKKQVKGYLILPDSSRLEFLETFLANNFALLDAEYNFSGSSNREGIADSPRVLKTLSNSPKVLRDKCLASDGLCCFISICKFGSFKNLFTMFIS